MCVWPRGHLLCWPKPVSHNSQCAHWARGLAGPRLEPSSPGCLALPPPTGGRRGNLPRMEGTSPARRRAVSPSRARAFCLPPSSPCVPGPPSGDSWIATGTSHRWLVPTSCRSELKHSSDMSALSVRVFRLLAKPVGRHAGQGFA